MGDRPGRGRAHCGGFWAIQKPTRTEFGTVAVMINEDANVAGNGPDPIRSTVTDAAVSLADDGGGRLVVVQASGGPARQVASVDMRIDGPDGQPEHDRETLRAGAGQRVDDAFADAGVAAAEGDGRDILGLLVGCDR